MDTFTSPPSLVLLHFAPHTRGLVWQRAPSGFSGAEVWRGEENGTPRLALKGWPPGVAADRVRQIHLWMNRAAHLPFVPKVFVGTSGTVCVAGNRAWDCCEWKSGAPRLAPTTAEVEAACEAVARLHLAWGGESRRGPCPGVRNRLRILAENESLLRAGPGAMPPVSPLLDPLLRRAVIAAARLAPFAVSAMQFHEHRDFPLQPCVRDLRAEHVLLEGDRVTGIVDFGAAEVDHPAVDLARLLGDYSPDESLVATGVRAYQRGCGADEPSEAFVLLLARTGAVCSLLGWLSRLAVRREPVSNGEAILARLSQLLSRVESISHF